MSMTRKDYDMIASTISAMMDRADPTWIRVIDGLADAFTRDNPRFDRLRFVQSILTPPVSEPTSPPARLPLSRRQAQR